MTAFSLKLFVALMALILAFVSLWDHPTIERKAPKTARWWRRLSRAGWLKLTVAGLTFLAIGANEAAEYRSGKAADEQARADKVELNKRLEASEAKLDDAQSGMALLINETARMRVTNKSLLKVLDKSVIKADVARIPPDDLGRTLPSNDTHSLATYVRNTSGKTGFPRKGDIIEWNISCRDGAVPALPDAGRSCRAEGYGRLLAFSYPVVLDATSGRKVMVGTLSNDSDMVFQPSSMSQSCEALSEELQRNGCEAELIFWREGRTQFLENEQDADIQELELSPSGEEACRKYEALYGQSCEQALRDMDGEN